MSRTFRKRITSFENYYKNTFYGLSLEEYIEKYHKDTLPRAKAKYGSKTCKWYTFGLPRWFRNMVNRKRRAKDRQEIWKEVNIENYEEQCSKWNCADNNNWGYW
jgi:hypothetical protein